MRVILTGGGTGGHIYPSIAIANRIKKEYKDAEILYIGTPNSLEEKILKCYDYNFKTINVKGFQRKLNLENIKRFFIAVNAINSSKKIIKEFKPDLIIGTGGYVSGPVVYAGSLMNIKTFIHEQNSYPGITNKLLAKKANIIYLGFEEARKKIKTKSIVKTIGNIVREEFLNDFNKEKIKEELGITASKFILVSGGSGGSSKINEEFKKIIPKLVSNDIGFIFSTGKNDYKNIHSQYSNIANNKNYILVEYISDMCKYIACSDLCIISAGATTISEVNAIGRASIIIPKSYTAENHQLINAKMIEKSNAGICIKEEELTSDILYDVIMNILNDKAKINLMEKNSKSLYKNDPLDEIMNDIEKYFRRNNV